MKFERLGISFQYPDNWTLDDQDAVAGHGSVTVYSPGGAFWTVAIHPRAADPGRLAQAALDAMREEYEEVEAEEIRETLAGHEILGFNLNFFYLDLTNTACIRSVRTKRTTYTIFYQAEDRDFDRVGQVFQAMTVSLLTKLQ
jgi:hypothetical protein